jgi:hypothetical protein
MEGFFIDSQSVTEFRLLTVGGQGFIELGSIYRIMQQRAEIAKGTNRIGKAKGA